MAADPVGYFITWTTYGTWLPGDTRGWRKRIGGSQQPEPLLEQWCRKQMVESSVRLDNVHRAKVEAICLEHCCLRGWELHAANARSNHVHVVVASPAKPKVVRDQLKANGTRVLRQAPHAMAHPRIWTRGGDCEVLYSEDELHAAIQYVLEGQDAPHSVWG